MEVCMPSSCWSRPCVWRQDLHGCTSMCGSVPVSETAEGGGTWSRQGLGKSELISYFQHCQSVVLLHSSLQKAAIFVHARSNPPSDLARSFLRSFKIQYNGDIRCALRPVV